jgi:hypothetical protein
MSLFFYTNITKEKKYRIYTTILQVYWKVTKYKKYTYEDLAIL